MRRLFPDNGKFCREALCLAPDNRSRRLGRLFSVGPRPVAIGHLSDVTSGQNIVLRGTKTIGGTGRDSFQMIVLFEKLFLSKTELKANDMQLGVYANKS